MMTLLDLAVRIGVQDDASSKIASVSSNIVSEADSVSTTMIAKAQLVAEAIKTAATTAYNAIKGFLSSALSAYGTYEQQIGGMQTFFGDAADTVIQNAKNAYQTAGMSANQYMTNISRFATTLITSVAKRRAGVLKEDTTAQQKALTDQSANLEKALSKQYSAKQRALDKEVQQLQKALAKQVDAQQEANDELIEQKQRALEDEYDEQSKSLSKQVEDYRRATDERVKEINREYTERLKLIDEEEYRRVKAIEDQIDALNGQTDAERLANKKREQEQKLADYARKIAEAKTLEDRAKAEQELSDLKEDIAQDERERERKDQISKLKDDKSRIQEQYEQRRKALKEETDKELEVYKEQRAEGLKNLQENNALQLNELKRHQSDVLKEFRKSQSNQIKAMQEANAEMVEDRRESNRLILESIKDSNDAQVEAMRASVAEQQRLLQEAANANSGFVEATAEDQEEAARIADMAMRDMADNAAKTGTALSDIENAYSGFSRGIFTMLDNLRLGYDGSREEMERLLSDAESLKAKQGEVVDYSIDSFADIVEAIHVVQTEWGFANTAFEEGGTTLEGSIGRVHAAWENWLVSLGDPEWDVSESTQQLMESVGNAAALIIPRVETILTTLFAYVSEHGPEIAQQLKDAFMRSLPDEWKEKLKDFEGAWEAFIGAIGAAGEVLKAIGTVLGPVIEAFSNVSGIIAQLIPIVAGARVGFVALGAIAGIIGGPFTALISIIGLVVGAIVGFIASNEDAQRVLGDIWNGIVEFFTNAANAIGDIMGSIGKGIADAWNGVLEFFRSIPVRIALFFKDAGTWLINAGWNIISGFFKGLQDAWNNVTGWISGIGQWIVDHKGPKAYDLKLLEPNGQWVMQSLEGGLRKGFERRVMPFVEDMAGAIESGFGTPTLSAQFQSAVPNQLVQQQQASRDLNVILELDRVQFGRLVYRLNDEETQRVGVRLAGGYA